MTEATIMSIDREEVIDWLEKMAALPTDAKAYKNFADMPPFIKEPYYARAILRWLGERNVLNNAYNILTVGEVGDGAALSVAGGAKYNELQPEDAADGKKGS